jgi:hypothetical protein
MKFNKGWYWVAGLLMAGQLAYAVAAIASLWGTH